MLIWSCSKSAGGKEFQLEGAFVSQIVVRVAALSITCLLICAAQKPFERLEQYPEGEQGATLRSLISVKDITTVSVALKAPYAATWSAVKVIAQKLDKLGNHPIIGVNEQSGRIQNGKIQLESMTLSGSLLD